MAVSAVKPISVNARVYRDGSLICSDSFGAFGIANAKDAAKLLYETLFGKDIDIKIEEVEIGIGIELRELDM